MEKITNIREVLDALADRLEQDAIEELPYQVDIYLYIRDGKAELDDFVNVGGNSWLDDDHYLLHTLPQHNDRGCFDLFDSIPSAAEVLDVTEEYLIHRAWEYVYDEDPGELSSIDYSDVYDMIRHSEDLTDKLQAIFEEYVRDNLRCDIEEQALDILNRFEHNVDDVEIEWPEGGI